MKFEQDEVELTGGVRHGVTLGGPVAIRVGNTEWPKWETVMSPDPVDAGTNSTGQARNAPLTRPRPGHADLAGMQKFGHTDARPDPRAGQRAGDRRAGRARRGRAAAARRRRSACEIVSHVVALGSVAVPDGTPPPAPGDLARIDDDPVRCADAGDERAR